MWINKKNWFSLLYIYMYIGKRRDKQETEESDFDKSLLGIVYL